jgi:hypothetical protein
MTYPYYRCGNRSQTASGKYAFRLSSAMGAQLVSGSQNLAQGKKYILSFWALGPVPAGGHRQYHTDCSTGGI